MSDGLKRLRERLAEVQNLQMASAVLGWDQRTYMPEGGSAGRARQKGTLARLAHEIFVDRQTGDLLAQAADEVSGLPEDHNDRALVRVAKRDYERTLKVPTSLVVELEEVTTLAEGEWVKARATSDFALFAPWLKRIVELKRQYAAAVGFGKRIYDALLEDYEPGATCEDIDPVFKALREQTIPLIAATAGHRERITDAPLRGDFDIARQQAFAEKVIKDCGFDFGRGRLDVTVHPFCTHFSQNDVRITTRYDPQWFSPAFFGTMHEMGHAFYEMNTDPALEGTLLASGTSLGVHESQSRLWENLVGRSRGFWEHYYPELVRAFPAMGKISLETFYQAINRVTPSLIRVEADEMTFNMHIILRYEMEIALLEGSLSVADAPAAWNKKMQDYLGITPPNDRLGILQDVHWCFGGIGYFPTYTLGNILSVQFFNAAVKAHPSIPAEIGRGKFGLLFEWLKENVHRPGRKLKPAEVVMKATGEALTIAPYVAYLKGKYSAIYG